MKINMHLPAVLAVLPLLVMLSIGSASAQTNSAPAQTNIGKTILDKLSAKITKLETACSRDIKKYCKDVTPGEGRMMYCMQAHDDKISPQCAYELGETAVSVQASVDLLKGAAIACFAEITGVCGKIQPGQGRIASCLMANRSTVSKECGDGIQKVEAMAAQ